VSPWQAPSQFLYEYCEPFAAAMRAAPSSAFDVLERLAGNAEGRAAFARARDADDGMVLPHDVLFPAQVFPFELTLATPGRGETIRVRIDDAETLACLRAAMSGEIEDEAEAETCAELEEAALLSTDHAACIDCTAPGIYRLQHASLLFRSETTTVITDPVFTDDWVWAGNLPRVDAVVISHGHGDHFSLASLMQFPRDTTIVVPAVARGSMLTDDMATLLRHAGFRSVVEATWYSRVRVGDIEISVYPFYGEQPWVGFAAPVAELRNAGNTYVIDVEGHKTWILIDAGVEHGCSMIDVAAQVADDHGELDLVMSNLRVFPWHPGQIDGSGRYLFCFPIDRLEDPSSWPQGTNITLGPDGVREILRATQARHFFPYAHWWHAPGSGSPLVDGYLQESAMVASIACETLPRTRAGSWGVGDRLMWRRGGEIAVDSFQRA
jgi:glyoxylase-like metal-dependent hydrolase (beta-lactamase superfamily II)